MILKDCAIRAFCVIRVPFDSTAVRVPMNSTAIRVPLDSTAIRVPFDGVLASIGVAYFK